MGVKRRGGEGEKRWKRQGMGGKGKRGRGGNERGCGGERRDRRRKWA